jgi:peptidoglycan hydrolase CwlO-like protein
MTKIFILLAQSATGAVITIILILLVAATIGYVTAWLYAKSVYKPVIKGLEADKENLINNVEGLKAEVKKLHASLDSMNEKVSSLEKELSAKDKEIEALKIEGN